MNLNRHLAVLWQFRGVAFAGLFLGLLLAFLAAFQVSFKDGFSAERRGSETWSSKSSILVTQTGFPWGRVTLPGASTGSTPDAQTRAPNTTGVEFADPGRFSNLAILYSVISHSDQVRALLPGRPEPEQIKAIPLDATGNGTSFLPIIELTTTGDTAAEARRLNQNTLDGLESLLKSEQRANDIPRKDRVQLSLLNAPSDPTLIAGRSKTPSILAFLLCMVGAVALAHLLAGLRRNRAGDAMELDDANVSVVSTPPGPSHPSHEPDLDDDIPVLDDAQQERRARLLS